MGRVGRLARCLGQPELHGELAAGHGPRVVEHEPGLRHPAADGVGAEPEPLVVVLGLQELERVWSEVDHEQASAGRHQPCRGDDRAARVVEVVQHLVDDDEVERGPVERHRVHVALAQLDPVGVQLGAFEVGAGDRQHRVAGIETHQPVGVAGEQFEHPPGAGADVEQGVVAPASDGLDDGRLDDGLGGVQRAHLVPVGSDPGEVLLGCGRPLRADEGEPVEVAGEHPIERVDGVEHVVGELAERAVGDDREVDPRTFAVTVHQAGIGEQLEVPRDAWLGLTADLREVGDGQFAMTQQGDQPQTRVFPDRPQRGQRGCRAQAHEPRI